MANPNFSKIYNRFLSRTSTVLLILFLTGLYLLGLLIPQKQFLSAENYQAWQQASPMQFALLDSLKLTAIYSSPLTLVATATFFLHLILVTAKRIPQLMRELSLPDRVDVPLATVERLEHVTIGQADATCLHDLKELVAARGYRIIEGEHCFKGVKNNISLLGSLVFHISFLLVLLGALTIFHTRFRGDAYVAEQQDFGGQSAEYRKRMRYSDLRTSLPDVRFQVAKINPRFAGLEPLSLHTDLLVTYKGRTFTGTTDINHPFTTGSLSILISDLGVAPLLQIVDRQGRDIVTAFALLKIMRGEIDTFEIPGSPYSLHFRFWPDYAVDAHGNALTQSYAVKNPLFEVAVYRNGELLSNGHVIRNPGDFVDFDSFRLTIPEIRYYGNFNVVEERGGAILIIGYLLAVGGLIFKIICRKKTVYALLCGEDNARLMVACQTEYFRGEISELNELVAKLGTDCRARGTHYNVEVKSA